MTDIDITTPPEPIPPDAPRNAANADEYVERMKQGSREELVERLSTAQAAAQSGALALAQHATTLDECALRVLEGLSQAEDDLGLLATAAEQGEIVEARYSDEDLRALYGMFRANDDAREDAQ